MRAREGLVWVSIYCVSGAREIGTSTADEEAGPGHLRTTEPEEDAEAGERGLLAGGERDQESPRSQDLCTGGTNV